MGDEMLKMARHEIVLTNRGLVEITGVIRVESFDSEEFLLQTDCGYLGIRGQDLHIKTLDLEEGKVTIEGHLIDLGYLDGHSTPAAERAKGILGRIFR
jgi:sporulation protein YabP